MHRLFKSSKCSHLHWTRAMQLSMQIKKRIGVCKVCFALMQVSVWKAIMALCEIHDPYKEFCYNAQAATLEWYKERLGQAGEQQAAEWQISGHGPREIIRQNPCRGTGSQEIIGARRALSQRSALSGETASTCSQRQLVALCDTHICHIVILRACTGC